MPRRREGPVKNKQTGYFFFDEYVGFPPDKKRIRISLRTKDPAIAQWLWNWMRLGELYKLRWDKHIKDDKIVLERTETKQKK